MIHEFHLSPPGSGGVSCDESGAFVDAISLLRRVHRNGRDEWRPRDSEALSREMSARYGLPIDMASKRGGLEAIAKALNEGDLARAQIATVLLGVPHPPSLAKGAPSRERMFRLVRDLHWSGLLKADWDSDKHPRWPAGAPGSQGGQFAPKDEGGTGGEPSANSSPPPNDNKDDDSGQRGPNDEDLGIYERYGRHIGGPQVASATALPAGGWGLPAFNPAIWANLKWLANGAFELGSGQIILAAALLAAMDPTRERNEVNKAIDKFGFDPTNAADVLAARAYVWAQHFAPWNYSEVPWSGSQNESVSQSIMAVELAKPGTLYLALQGDQTSKRYIDAAVADGMKGGLIAESRPRPPDAPPALQTTSPSARAALNLQPNDQMQAHHLIPANVWGDKLKLATAALQAGWQPDSDKNLIDLPANMATQAKLAAGGTLLPIHNSSHGIYDSAALGEIICGEAERGPDPTPAQARAIFETAAFKMRKEILDGRWLPRLR